MAVSGFLSAELAATCNALGFYDGQKYHLEPHCKETIRDLIRYLRRDEGGSHEIRRYLGNAKLLQTDLLPMVQCHHQDIQLFDIALRLVVNLTNPALLVYNEIIPTDKFDRNYYLEIVSHLQLYKESFNDHRPWAPFTERLSALLAKPMEDRSEDDQRTIERILILVRNVLHVPSSADQDQRPDNDASVHDQVLWGLHQSGMIDLLLYMSSSEKEIMFAMHLLEILCLMLREQPPELLAKTASQRNAEEKDKDDQELLRIRHAELQAKREKHKKFTGTRHSNFGGTFVIKNLKSTSDNNDLIYHKPVHDSKYISLDTEKKPVKLPKNRQFLKCESVERKSALSVRLILKQVCVEFLNAAYNPMMHHVRGCFHRGQAQKNDESYYFTAMRFFMEFNRHYDFQVKYVSETMSVQTFQFIQKYLEQWHELMMTDKKKLALWSYRSHLALRAYKELLHNLAFMDRSSDESVRESSKVIKSNVFYVIEYREMLLTLINMYKREKYSRKYLIDLVETIHIFTKLLCDFGKDKKMVIQKTARRAKKKSNLKKLASKQDQASAETIWNLACDDIYSTLMAPVECDVVPFDATSELAIDEQKLEAIKKIQFNLKNGDYKQAVALLRASREVWPEHNTFGTITADASEELELLKDIFLANLGSDSSTPFTEEANGSDAEGSDEGECYTRIVEKNFETVDFVNRFANPRVVKICNTLLSTYDTNSETTNHCVVKLLYRIAFECKLPAMLFQASLFIKFRNILANYQPKHKELAKLAVYITRKFTEVAQNNKTAFVELLFPKHVKDACEIVDGYGTYQDNKNKRAAWEEHEEDELRRLDEEYRATNVKEDKVDWLLENLINKERSKRAVVKKMKELGLEVPEAKPKGTWSEEEEDEIKRLYEECDKDMPEKLIVTFIFERMTSKNHSERAIKKKMYDLNLLRRPVKKLKTWTEEQDEDLTELFNLNRNEDDVMRPIMAVLGNLRSRQNVVAALLRLGLIASKDEVRKKSRKPRSGPADSDESDEESECEDDGPAAEDTPPAIGPTTAALHREIPHAKYLLGGLKWLTTVMNDNLEDLDANVFDSDVPMLPLSEEPVLSMENPAFKEFLHAIGFKKPLAHQEVYWRVSSTWNERDFRTRVDLFNFLIENHERSLEELASQYNEKLSAAVGSEVDVLSNDAPVAERFSRSSANEEDSSQVPKRDRKKKRLKKSKIRGLVEAAREDSDSDNDTHQVDRDQQSASSGDEDQRNVYESRRLSSDAGGSSSDEDDPGVRKSFSESKQTSLRIQDDSDDEIRSVSTNRMQAASEDSDTEAPHNKTTNVLGSDDDEHRTGGFLNGSGSTKKRNIIDSDDDSQEPLSSINKSPGPVAHSYKEKNSSSKKKRRIIDSEEESDSNDLVDKPSVSSESSLERMEVVDEASKSATEGVNVGSSVAAKQSKAKKKSKAIDSDLEIDSQSSVASETPAKQSKAKKKSKAIESDLEMDSQSSVAAETPVKQSKAKKKSKAVESDLEMDSESSVAAETPRRQSKAKRKSKAVESDLELDSQSSVAAGTPAKLSKAKKTSKAIESDLEIDSQSSAAAETPVKHSKAKKKSKAIESDLEMDSQSSAAAETPAKAKKKSVESDLRHSESALLDNPTTQKKRKMIVDSDEEIDDLPSNIHSSVSKTLSDSRKRKKLSSALDSDDEENVQALGNRQNPNRTTTTAQGILDSDDD